jgi:hypothetical protein
MFREHMPFLLILVDFQVLEITRDLTFSKVLKVKKVILDLNDHLVRKVNRDLKETKVTKAKREIQGLKDYKVNKERKVTLDLKDLLEKE